MAFLDRYAPWMLGILRIVTALVFMEHGTQKFFHFPPPEQRFGGPGARAAGGAAKAAANALSSAADTAASALSSAADTAMAAVSSMASNLDAATGASVAPPAGGPPGLSGLFLVAGILETVGGLALVLGLLTRPVAFILAGECAYIFWALDVGRAGSIFPATNGGEDAVIYCFVFLYLVFAGSGAFALDNLFWRRRVA